MFTVNKNSWHYKLLVFLKTSKSFDDIPDCFIQAEKDFNYYAYPPRDFCTYWRTVLLWPLTRVIVMSLFWAGILYLIFTNFVVSVALGLAALFAYGAGFFTFWIGFLILQYIKSKVENRRSEDKDGLFKTMYTSYKDKTCPMVTYEDDKNV